MHHTRKITIKQVNDDNKFSNLTEILRPIPVNIVGAGEHKKYPAVMVCGCVIKSVKELNAEIVDNGISDELSPGTLITSRVNPNYKEIQALNFGDYVQLHDPSDITNTNESIPTGAIVLYPSKNEQGSWHFMSLDTGRRIHRYSWEIFILPLAEIS